jgi:hypothetical protein
VTIAVPAIGDTFEAQLEEDDFRMLWLNEPNRKRRRMGVPRVAGAQDRVAHRERVTRRAGAAGRARVRERQDAVKGAAAFILKLRTPRDQSSTARAPADRACVVLSMSPSMSLIRMCDICRSTINATRISTNAAGESSRRN